MKIKNFLIIIRLIPLISLKEQFKNNFDDSKYNKNLELTNTDSETIKENILANHNDYRKTHQVKDLVRNSVIEEIAQQYSEYLVSFGRIKHSDNTYNWNNIGENLYIYNFCNDITGKEASQSWYYEYLYYDYNHPVYNSKTSSFTQLVWKNS